MEQKVVRIQFLDLLEEQRETIESFIEMQPDDAKMSGDTLELSDDRRAHVRVSVELHEVDMQSAKTKSLPASNLVCDVVEISRDGMAIAVPGDTKLVKNSLAFFILHFLEPEQLVRGVVKGVK